MNLRPKFSMLTLLLASMLSGSAGLLWLHWEPWHAVFNIEKTSWYPSFSNDSRFWLTHDFSRSNVAADYLWARLNAIRMIDLNTGQTCSSAKLGEEALMRIWRLSPDGTRAICQYDTQRDMVSGTQLYELALWNIQRDGPFERVAGNHEAFFMANGKLMALNGSWRFHDPFGPRPDKAVEERVRGVAELFDAIYAAKTLPEFARVTSGIGVDAFPDQSGNFLVTHAWGADRYQLWDLNSMTRCSTQAVPAGSQLAVTFKPEANAGYAHLTPDGNRLIVDALRHPFVYDTRSGASVGVFKQNAQSKDFTHDGSRLLLEDSRHVIVWDVDKDSTITVTRNTALRAHQFSPDGTRVAAYYATGDGIEILDSNSGATLAVLGANNGIGTETPLGFTPLGFTPDGESFLTYHFENNRRATIWKRRRPEWWWGVAWLPELWMTAAFTALLCWSLRRDWRYFKP
jgi:hypothetical protein